MPTSNTTEDGSFYALLAPYGIATGINSGSVTGTGTDGKQYNIAEAPLYFVRSGHTNIGFGKLLSSGIGNWEWTSQPSSSNVNYAYRLHFNAITVYPADVVDRYIAFPLRCLARL